MNPITKQSLETIRQGAIDGKLGAFQNGTCVYKEVDTGKCCGIGIVLPEQVIDAVISCNLNAGFDYDSLVSNLRNEFNLEELIGFTVEQGKYIQEYHDYTYGSFTKGGELIAGRVDGFIDTLTTIIEKGGECGGEYTSPDPVCPTTTEF